MKNSIEENWKEGFLNEKSLVAPRINDLYNQKSKHLVDRMKRIFRVNLIVIVILAIFSQLCIIFWMSFGKELSHLYCCFLRRGIASGK